MSLDLHIHSTFSDGTLTPAEVVGLAGRRRLSGISLTDHDTIDGYLPAVEAACGLQLEVVSGLEVSALHKGSSMHILGYLMDPGDAGLQKMLSALQQGREERNAEILCLLRGFGIAIEEEELRRVSGGGQTGRPHIARLLVARGVVGSMLQAFEKYLGREGRAYIPRPVPTAEEAIAVLRDAGGISVLAHPQQMDPALDRLPALLDALVDFGLDGIEAYYPTHSAKIRRRLIAIAERHGLVLTGGSDFHGDIRPGTSLAGGSNVRVPGDLLVPLKERAAQR
jgi:hypothetical protein